MPIGPRYPFVKRAVDLVVAGILLVLLVPFFLLISLAIALDSRGPVFFRHERVGERFRRIGVWKFRSMWHNARDTGPEITRSKDPRITRVGRWLRATKLDELPQLWNVVLGEMSLVGPRPEVPKYVEMFRREFEEILEVRPGMTDEASIVFRSEERLLEETEDTEREYIGTVLPRKLELAQLYVRELSMGKDLSIILRTCWRVVVP